VEESTYSTSTVALITRTANQTLQKSEVQEVICNLNLKKSSDYDLITGKILKGLPINEIQYLSQLFNAVLLNGYLPAQWKVAQVILIFKPVKPRNSLTSYWPICLLSNVSKIFEKLVFKRVLKIVENKRLPNHQFGFRERHSKIKQTHRIIQG
jgi:hypothetical protein